MQIKHLSEKLFSDIFAVLKLIRTFGTLRKISYMDKQLRHTIASLMGMMRMYMVHSSATSCLNLSCM